MKILGSLRNRPPRTTRTSAVDRRSRSVGQSLVEFSVTLPILLSLVGMAIDAARVYQMWTNLEAATRDAAQYLATSNVDPLSPDYTKSGPDADAKAAYILNLATGQSFQRSLTQGNLDTCNQPRLTTTFTTNPSPAAGGTMANPVGTARVMACIPFRTLFAYPFLTVDGNWILYSDRQVKVLVGR